MGGGNVAHFVMYNPDYYNDTDDGTAREIGPFDLAADQAFYDLTPVLVELTELDRHYLLTLVDYLKEKEIWEPDDDWAAVIDYIEALEYRLQSPLTDTEGVILYQDLLESTLAILINFTGSVIVNYIKDGTIETKPELYLIKT